MLTPDNRIRERVAWRVEFIVNELPGEFLDEFVKTGLARIVQIAPNVRHVFGSVVIMTRVTTCAPENEFYQAMHAIALNIDPGLTGVIETAFVWTNFERLGLCVEWEGTKQ